MVDAGTRGKGRKSMDRERFVVLLEGHASLHASQRAVRRVWCAASIWEEGFRQWLRGCLGREERLNMREILGCHWILEEQGDNHQRADNAAIRQARTWSEFRGARRAQSAREAGCERRRSIKVGWQ